MKVIIETVNFKRGLVTYEIDCYNYVWLEIFYYIEVEPEEILVIILSFYMAIGVRYVDSLLERNMVRILLKHITSIILCRALITMRVINLLCVRIIIA